MSNYNKLIGTSVGGALGTLLAVFVPWGQLGVPEEQVMEVVSAIIVLLAAAGTYVAPANHAPN